MFGSWTVRIVEGRHFFNGKPSDAHIDHEDHTILICDHGDEEQLRRTWLQVFDYIRSPAALLANPSASPARLPTDEVLEGVPSVRIVDQRMRCPHCPQSYVNGGCFAKHLRYAHQDAETAERVKSRKIWRKRD